MPTSITQDTQPNIRNHEINVLLHRASQSVQQRPHFQSVLADIQAHESMLVRLVRENEEMRVLAFLIKQIEEHLIALHLGLLLLGILVVLNRALALPVVLVAALFGIAFGAYQLCRHLLRLRKQHASIVQHQQYLQMKKLELQAVIQGAAS